MPAKQKFTANQVYAVIKPFELTPEQESAVQDASVTGPALVVAGAGSGKTELMAVRVLWLVANGHARPEEILGLTFTRKAASELSKRIYESLLKMRDTELWPEDLDYDFTAPTISTYNAYANGLFRDHALAIGYEPEAVLLTEAAAFQLAREVILKQGSEVDSRLSDLDVNINPLVEAVLALAQSMNDNVANSTQVEGVIDDVVAHLTSLPRKLDSTDFTPFTYLADLLGPLAGTATVAKLADAYRLEKQRLSYVDYSDQVALAERAVREVPQTRQRERERFSQVLLDEYQDTSFLQTQLLKNLFADHPVFAVGDPNQSIYGWRGASASNLNDFYQDFGSKEPGSQERFSLSTSWRNPEKVLELANSLVGELKVLELKPRPNSGSGAVEVQFLQDMNNEALAIARWFKQKMQADENTGALLMRKRSNMAMFVDALQSEGLDVEVVGLGGLLEMPEVVDLISALRVIHFPESGSQLIRLLSGPRWRIAPKDIERLHRYAVFKSRMFNHQQEQSELEQKELDQKVRESIATEDAVSLVDALDLLLDEKFPEKSTISESSMARLKDAAALLRNMRRRVGMPLVEFVRAVEQELWLDIEVAANPRRKNPMAHLNAFASVVSGYAASNPQPTLGGFLDWLEFADQRERFELPTTTPEKGVVQVLTIHAAKGLEWQNVAVANLVEGDFPGDSRGSSGWLGFGKLPYPLRGDKTSLPTWNYLAAQTQPEAKKSQEDFKAASRLNQLNEELRLMYVAVTRTKSDLLLTGSYWKPANKNPRTPSRYLVQTSELLALEIEELQSQANPLSEVESIESWPLDPLGEKHRLSVELAAAKTKTAIEQLADTQQALEYGDLVQLDINLLLAERDEAISRTRLTQLPVRVPASRFKDFVSDMANLAERSRRPMPQQPYKQTRTGTLFHSWVENRFSAQKLLETPISEDDSILLDSIQELQENFESSRFANLVPIEIEQEIQVTVGANTFICKLDAVFATETGVEIIDWKTGAAPKDEADLALKTLQLALYRLAYSRYSGLPENQIEVGFYFVSQNLEVRPTHVPSSAEVLELWSKALET